MLGRDPADLRGHWRRARFLRGRHGLVAAAERMKVANRADLRRTGNMSSGQHVTWRDEISAATAFAVLLDLDHTAEFHEGRTSHTGL